VSMQSLMIGSDVRAVACDIDGTITDSRRFIQVNGIEALRKVQDRGTIVMIASGNVLPVAFGLSTYIGTKGPVIAENGGLVYFQGRTYQLESNELPLKAYAYLKEAMPEVERLFTDNWRLTEVALKRSFDLERIQRILAGWDLEIEATGFAIHIMNKGHSKLAGVEKGCELLGIGLEGVVAIGDSDNDAKMLAGCGFGIAVGNASPSAKAAADFVAKGTHSDGVVEGLRYLELL
jgi:phosphoglycolate phosphatase (TIGR01487 family)